MGNSDKRNWNEKTTDKDTREVEEDYSFMDIVTRWC